MARKIGRVAIKKLIFSLVVVCTIALGAVWMILSPAPIAKSTGDKPAKRALAYEQAIADVHHDETSTDGAAEKKAEIPPFKTVTSAPQADTATPDNGNDPDAIQDLSSDTEDTASQDMASLPDESADAQDGSGNSQSSQDMAALPNGQAAPYDGVPPLPGEQGAGSGQYGTDGAEQWGDERGPPNAYGPQPQYDA